MFVPVLFSSRICRPSSELKKCATNRASLSVGSIRYLCVIVWLERAIAFRRHNRAAAYQWDENRILRRIEIAGGARVATVDLQHEICERARYSAEGVFSRCDRLLQP